MTNEEMWNDDRPVARFDIDVPGWIESNISPSQVISIYEGGCASGAYMPAVTYHVARDIMAEHGNDVLQFLEDYQDELPQIPKGENWAGIAVFFLSSAVDLWADIAYSHLQTCEADDADAA